MAAPMLCPAGLAIDHIHRAAFAHAQGEFPQFALLAFGRLADVHAAERTPGFEKRLALLPMDLTPASP